MDGLRRQMVFYYNSLVEKLNSKIQDKSWDPTIIVCPEAIQKELDGLHSCIVTLAFTYMEGKDGWEPMPDDTKFSLFNPQDGEEDED